MEENHLVAKIGQYALIENDEGKLLVLERVRSKTWCLPGGRLHDNEMWSAALIREVKEETGLECADPRPIDVSVETDPYQTKYCVYFLVSVKSFNALALSDEHSAYRWIAAQDIPTLTFESEGVRAVVGKYLNSE